MPEILGIIPARANSKRVTGKNLRVLNGKPLVQYAIEAALKSKLLTTVVLSSDSDEILKHATEYGDRILAIKRPSQFATDDSPAIEFVNHALEYLSQTKNKQFEYVAIIQPSSPLTIGSDIDMTIQALFDHDADCAVSVREIQCDHHPSKLLLLEENKLIPLCKEIKYKNMDVEMEKVYVRNGSVYVSSLNLIRQGRLLSENCAGYIMPAERSVDINDESDLLFAEFLLSRKEQA